MLILAGGRSARMGRDKTWMELDGEPLVERVARRVLPLADELIFCTNSPEPFRGLAMRLLLPVHLVADRHPGAGPIAGLHAALSVARNDVALALAVDMPFVDLALLRHMATLAPGYDAVVPQIPNPRTADLELEPLHAFYRRSCLPAISMHLAAGDRRVVSFLPDVRTRTVLPDEIARFDPGFRSFYNVNTPEDWAEANRRISDS